MPKVNINSYTIAGDEAILRITRKDKSYVDCLIDAEDIKRLSQYQWRVAKDRKGCLYVKTKDGLYIHRFIMGAPRDMVVDHKFHNTLDNRKSQLRIVTNRENVCSRVVNKTSTSGIRGVSWYAKTNKWKAAIKIHGIRYFLGYYEDKYEAARVYNREAYKHFGTYAVTRTPIKLKSE